MTEHNPIGSAEITLDNFVQLAERQNKCVGCVDNSDADKRGRRMYANNQRPLGYPTDAEPQIAWGGKTGRINIGGGAGIPGGYSIELNPEGETSVEFYRD